MRVTSRFRLIIILLLGLLELLLLVSSLYDNSVPIGQYGFLIEGDGVTISEVEPYKSAALAGIQPGDRIVYKSLSLFGRHILTFKEPVSADAPLTFQLDHKGQLRTVTLNAQPMPIAFIRLNTIVSALSGFVFGIIGLMLVMFRPSRMTWAFAFIAPEILLPSYFPLLAQHSDSIAGAGYDIVISMIYAIQITSMLIFASRFPDDKPHGLTAIVDSFAIPVGVIIAVMYFYVTLTLRFTTFQLPYWEIISELTSLLPSLAALIAMISTYITTQGSTRSRLAPVIGSFILLITLGVMQQIAPDFSSSYVVLFTVFILNAAAPALVAVTVAYGVIRHRVMDIDFILERTLVYSVLTTFVIASFAIIEFFVGKLFEGDLATIIQMAAAVSVGLSIDYIHTKMEHFIKVFFFRRRYAARKRLNKSAQIVQHATSLNLIDDMLVVDPVEALDLASAAVFRHKNDGYERVAAQGWDEETTTQLQEDDYLITRLRAEMRAIRMMNVHWKINHLPDGLARPIYIIPVFTGHQLEAILFYSGHRTGEDIDYDERKSLQGLARNAALAYGYLSEAQLHHQLDALKTQVRALEKAGKQLENIILKGLEGQS
ncbi:MAG: hypothetical protein P4M14_00130 [Gammaproteobacteria bacterium]|nr:hypothetical protein [Gammaproteobacteria bacterium]